MDKPQFVYATYIRTTQQQLWEALTSGDFTQQYWGGRRIDSDWQVGSPVRHRLPDGEVEWQGEVLRAEPPRLLSYTFDVLDDDEPPSRVTFELERNSASVVKLTLVHDTFEPDSEALQHIQRGWAGILANLKSLLETGEPLHFGSWS